MVVDTNFEDDDDYGISSYVKSKTQFDGVTNEMQVSYLKLMPDQGLELPLMSTGITEENIDFTIMLWFKINQDFNTKSAPWGDTPQNMQLFSFEESVACFFTNTLTLMCDAADRNKLQIEAGVITPGIWYHLTLVSAKDDQSFLMIQNNHETVAVDTSEQFGFRQNIVYNWRTCIGDCRSGFGFYGGVREFLLMHRTVTQQEAERAKNMIFTYDSSVKAYFRF